MADSPRSNSIRHPLLAKPISESVTAVCPQPSALSRTQPAFHEALITYESRAEGPFAFNLFLQKKIHGPHLCIHVCLHCLHFLFGFQPVWPKRPSSSPLQEPASCLLPLFFSEP
ncbi:hypothetical protein ACFX2J_028502 [Malus domestica]